MATTTESNDRNFERAVSHLRDIGGLFELDLGVIRDGLEDLAARLHVLEAREGDK